jgi:cation diffusion facilitator CzcD-associated flavoprotein CzcO
LTRSHTASTDFQFRDRPDEGFRSICGPLPVRVAERFGNLRGEIVMPGVTALGHHESRFAARHPGSLAFPGLTELSADSAAGLAEHRDRLLLDGLEALDATVAESLAAHVGGLSLAGLATLDPETANWLARSSGGLWLGGLTAITPAVAEALASHEGDLALNGVKSLTVEEATALAGHAGRLSLGGLRDLEPAVAAALTCHRGPLALDGLAAISVAAAEALAGHAGGLSLSGLQAISSEVAATLARHRGDLALDGIAALDERAAGALGRHAGWLSLASLRSLSPEAAERLAAHDGWVGLPAFIGPAESVAVLRRNDCVGLPRGLAAGESERESAGDRNPPEELGIVIIGAGFAGIAMAKKLLEQGRRDFAVLEKAESTGGTWRDNTYPGCECDVPAHVYSYSFAQEAGWSGQFAGQTEILAYLRRVATRLGVERQVRFNTTVRRLTWQEQDQRWLIEATDGRRFLTRAVIAATGGLHLPKLPHLPGLESFAGPVIHTARWRHDLDLSGRRVAVVGTGASAVQVIPPLARQVEQLVVFQRSPPWVLARPRGPAPLARRLLASVPGLQRMRRTIDFLAAEVRAIGFTLRPKFVERAQKQALRFMFAAVPEESLRRKLCPGYALGCKRVLLSNDYYPALRRENVSLVTDAIEMVEPHAIRTAAGGRHEVDAIVCATGFEPFDITKLIEIRGRGGRSLADDWRDGPEAFRGVAVAGYPNLFFLMGPNTALGHNSILFMIEAQTRYLIQCLRWLDAGRLAAAEVKAEVQQAYNRQLHERLEQTVWRSTEWRSGGASGGWAYPPCGSWYRHASGRNHTLWPGSALSYWRMMLRADRRHFLATNGSERDR